MTEMLRTLRLVLLAWEAVLVVGALALLAIGAPWAPLVAAYALVNAGIVSLAVLLERPRYSPGPGSEGGRWVGAGDSRFAAAAEVFIDPTTGVRMRVWADPETGDRQYRPDPG
jgi:hypothetical protein